MLEASNFVAAVQNRQGTYIACIEEIAFRNSWITDDELIKLAEPLMKTNYGKYLVSLIEKNEISQPAYEEVAYS